MVTPQKGCSEGWPVEEMGEEFKVAEKRNALTETRSPPR
jgi:hypothetical protein